MHFVKATLALVCTLTVFTWSAALAAGDCAPGPRVKRIVSDLLAVELDQVIETTRFQEDLGTDELDTVELVMALEDEFKVTINDDDAETLLTVGDAIHYIEARVTCPTTETAPAQ